MKPYYFFILLASCCSCQPLYVDGRIVNEEDQPIVKARIRQSTQPAERRVVEYFSDSDGCFPMAAFSLGDTLYIEAHGYESDTFIVECYPKRRLDFLLSKKIPISGSY